MIKIKCMYALLICMMLQGCFLNVRVHLYNNTPGILLIRTQNDKKYEEIKTGESFIYYNLKPIDVINRDKCVEWRYDNIQFPWGHGYIYFSPIFQNFRLQIDSSGEIYVLNANQHPLVMEYFAQPDGYPMHPDERVSLYPKGIIGNQ